MREKDRGRNIPYPLFISTNFSIILYLPTFTSNIGGKDHLLRSAGPVCVLMVSVLPLSFSSFPSCNDSYSSRRFSLKKFKVLNKLVSGLYFWDEAWEFWLQIDSPFTVYFQSSEHSNIVYDSQGWIFLFSLCSHHSVKLTLHCLW